MKPDWQNGSYFTASDLSGKMHGLYLTTDHAASSYGIPVFVDQETREAYGTFDMTGWQFWSFGSQEFVEKARKAGYAV